MFDFFKNLFGSNVNLSDLAKNGAQIIDVRTAEEYSYGKIPGSKNIPLQELKSRTTEINKQKPVITCCASGMRSESAKKILVEDGYEAYNGGGWQSLKKKIEE